MMVLREQRRKFSDMAANIRFIKKSCQSGSSYDDIRLMTAPLREIAKGDLAALYKQTDLKSPISIEAYKIAKEIEQKSYFFMLGGAKDNLSFVGNLENPSDEEIEKYVQEVSKTSSGLMPVMIGYAEDGTRTIISESIGFIYNHIPKKGYENESFSSDFMESKHKFTITEFFDSPVIIFNEKRVSRRDIISFFAYFRGGVHNKPDEIQSKKEQERGFLLTQLSESRSDFRDDLIHIYLSIAQNLTDSEDVNKFLEFVASIK